MVHRLPCAPPHTFRISPLAIDFPRIYHSHFRRLTQCSPSGTEAAGGPSNPGGRCPPGRSTCLLLKARPSPNVRLLLLQQRDILLRRPTRVSFSTPLKRNLYCTKGDVNETLPPDRQRRLILSLAGSRRPPHSRRSATTAAPSARRWIAGDWHNQLTVASDRIVLYLKDGQSVHIDPALVSNLSYGQEAHRRVGTMIALGILLTPIALFGLFHKTRLHYIGMEYRTADGKNAGLLIQAHKDNYRAVLQALRGATHAPISVSEEDRKYIASAVGDSGLQTAPAQCPARSGSDGSRYSGSVPGGRLPGHPPAAPAPAPTGAASCRSRRSRGNRRKAPSSWPPIPRARAYSSTRISPARPRPVSPRPRQAPDPPVPAGLQGVAAGDRDLRRLGSEPADRAAEMMRIHGTCSNEIPGSPIHGGQE